MNRLPQQSYNEWLVVRCQQGETEAFAQLVQQWQQRYLLYAMNRLGQREAAQDATQDCLLSISRSIHKLSDPAAFPKWSFQILERRCIDALRKTIRERKVLEENQQLLQVNEDQMAVADTTTFESGITVGQVLKMLDPRLAALLRLYYLEALSVVEIAEICDVPPGTIKSRLYYARKLLAQILDTRN